MKLFLALTAIALLGSASANAGGGCQNCSTTTHTEVSGPEHTDSIKRTATVKGNWINAATTNHLLTGSGAGQTSREVSVTRCEPKDTKKL